MGDQDRTETPVEKYRDESNEADDNKDHLAPSGSPRDGTPEGRNGKPPGLNPDGFSVIGSSVGDMAEAENNLKRAESMELLNVTLHQCARDGNHELMERLLSAISTNHVKKINAHDEDDLSPLHYAARYNHYHTVKLLVAMQVNVNDVDSEGSTALHFAARYKRMRINSSSDTLKSPTVESTVDNSVIMYMVHSNADVNANDNYGCTPLHYAAMRGNEVATKELLSCPGVDVRARDMQNMTALHMAASHNEMEIARMLIEANADLRCADEESARPLHYACMEGCVEIALMLFLAAESKDGWVTVKDMLNDKDNQNNTALHYAVENGSYDVTKLCIDRGANVNVTRNNDTTPLHLAAVAGHVRICELLLDHGARKNALDINQSTPLHKAAAYNHADVVEFLLDRGANIDKHDKDNFSPLLIAACNGHTHTIQMLLQRNADPCQVDKNDKTALFWAAEEDHGEALETLLNHPVAGQLKDQSDRYENSPLHIAAQKGFLNCVKILLDHEAKINIKNEEERAPIHLAAEAGRTHVVRELVRRDPMVINDEDEDSNTALHLASLSGHNKVVMALIEAAADIEARNCTLWTPLDCAAARGWTKTVKVLLDADAPVDPMDKSKTTPLLLAASRGHVDVVTLLIKSHAHVQQRDASNKNCLDMAIENGHKDVAMAIINSNKWQDALRNQSVDEKTGCRVTPMRKLIRKMPEVAETVFKHCTTSESHPDHPDYQITFNYEFLDDMYANWETDGDSISLSSEGTYDEDNKLSTTAQAYSRDSKVLKINHPLSIMVSCNQEDLLAHPLITSLLLHKWRSFGRFVYYTNLAIYCLFLTFLTGYVVTTPAPYSFTNRTGLDLYTGSECDKIQQYMESVGDPVRQHGMARAGVYVIIILAALNIIRELFQMVNAKLNYLGWENLIEWTIYITALLLVINFDTCQRETGLRKNWQWQLAAVSVFLAWIDLVLFIRKFPMFGIYVVMFTDVFLTFLRFFPVFFLFIVAFALAFFVVLSNQNAFQNVGLSMLKTSVMMIGEMDYGDIFLALEPGSDPYDPASVGSVVNYPTLSYALFVIFMVLLTIIIMNLLVGLAVDDIKAVQEKAELTRLAMQVELALNVESIVPQMIRRKFVVKCKTVYPNQYDNFLKRLMHLDTQLMSSSAIQKALDPELDDMERLEENVEKLHKTVNSIRYRIKNIESQNARMESMLKAFLVKENVAYEDEDATEDPDGVGGN